MRRALVLAGNGCGHTSPNPMVGCVIVKNDRIIGEGWHAYCGGLHAERNALKNCTEDPSGADLYVTLEPCCHYGEDPTVHRGHYPKQNPKGVCGMYGSQPEGGRQRCGDFEKAGHFGGNRGAGSGVSAGKRGVFPLYHDENPVRGHEICHDTGWENCGSDRRFQVGDRGSGAQLCACVAETLYRHHGRYRDGDGG